MVVFVLMTIVMMIIMTIMMIMMVMMVWQKDLVQERVSVVGPGHHHQPLSCNLPPTLSHIGKTKLNVPNIITLWVLDVPNFIKLWVREYQKKNYSYTQIHKYKDLWVQGYQKWYLSNIQIKTPTLSHVGKTKLNVPLISSPCGSIMFLTLSLWGCKDINNDMCQIHKCKDQLSATFAKKN